MPTVLSSVTCVSFGDSQREGGGATKMPMFSKPFRTRTRTRSLTRTRQQSIDRHPRSRAARATKLKKRNFTTAKRWKTLAFASTVWRRWLQFVATAAKRWSCDFELTPCQCFPSLFVLVLVLVLDH